MKGKGVASAVALLGLLVVACGDDATPAPTPRPTYRAGTRLRPVVQVIEGGPSVFVGMYDTALGLRVESKRFGDRLVWHPHMASIDPFADPSCETPLAIDRVDAELPRYAITRSPRVRDCVAPPLGTVYEVGEELSAGAAVYYRNGDGKCVEPPTTGEPMRYFRVGREVPASTFAYGGFVDESWAGGLTLTFEVSDDGAAQHFDSVRLGVDFVSPAYAADGVERWLPSGAYDAGGALWLDAACTVPIAESTGCFDVVRFARASLPTGPCNVSMHRVARLGDEISSFYSSVGTPCMSEDPATYRQRHWLLGEEVPPSSFAKVRRVQVGERVVATPAAADDDNPIERLYRWTDRNTGLACTISMTDAGLRCAPELSSYEFEDAECTTPLLRPPTDACATPVARYAMVRPRDGGFRHLHVGTGVFVSPAKVFHVRGGACEETKGGEFERLTPLPSSNLPAVAEVIE